MAMKPNRIPRAVLREAVKKAGAFDDYKVLKALEDILGLELSLDKNHDGFHYSPHKLCAELTATDFVECWSGDVNNPTVTRHLVGNCRVEV